jgi:hypothetical protein
MTEFPSECPADFPADCFLAGDDAHRRLSAVLSPEWKWDIPDTGERVGMTTIDFVCERVEPRRDIVRFHCRVSLDKIEINRLPE